MVPVAREAAAVIQALLVSHEMRLLMVMFTMLDKLGDAQ